MASKRAHGAGGDETSDKQTAKSQRMSYERSRAQNYLNLIPGKWFTFKGGPNDVMGIDLGYKMSSASEFKKCMPDKITYFTGDTMERYSTLKCCTGSFSQLILLWCPEADDLPELSWSLEDVWDAKRHRLETLAECFLSPGPFSINWAFDQDQYEKAVSRFPKSQAFRDLADGMQDAFRGGMYNGRAKDFITSLGRFLMAEEPKLLGQDSLELALYDDQRIITTETSDTVLGRVRYLDDLNYDTSVHFPQNKNIGRPRGHRTAAQSTSALSGATGGLNSGGTGSSSGWCEPKNMGDKVHQLSPDAILIMRDFLFITCVFECTRQTQTQSKYESEIQNFRQMASLMHYQDAMFGCLITPDDFCFHLALKEKETGTFTFYRTPEHAFKMSPTLSFDTKMFLKLAENLLQLIYLNAQRLKKQQEHGCIGDTGTCK